MPAPAPTFARLRAGLRRFAAARDWQQFHNAKDLALALSIEASELNELGIMNYQLLHLKMTGSWLTSKNYLSVSVLAENA